MKNQKEIITKVILPYLLMWTVGMGIFYFLTAIGIQRAGETASWQGRLIFSVIAGLIWALVGIYLSNKDEKIAAANHAISSAVHDIIYRSHP